MSSRASAVTDAGAGGARRHPGLLAACLFAAMAIVVGCVDIGVGPPSYVPGPPPGDTSQNAMLRFEATYERKVPVEYEKLLTSNFRFTFSSQSDPGLVAAYGNNWGKDDEVESTLHLFEGFTDEKGNFQGAASTIALSLDGASFTDDPSKPDSGAFYKVVIVPSVNLTITLAGGAGEHVIDLSAPHDFYLVRGDAALLDPNQESGADRWYIHRWDDKAMGSGDAPADSQSITWGRLKHQYRR